MNIRLAKTSVYLSSRQRTLFNIDELCVPAGAKLLITGPSGTGKTTLLHLIAGLLTPAAGAVFWDDKNLRDLSENELCRIRLAKFALVFQKLNLLEHLTALENVMLTLPNKNEARQRASAALGNLQLDRIANQRAGELSLGEQQRVAVARAVAVRPKVLLADEPTSSLDDANAEAVLNALFEVSKHSTLIVVSHDHRIQKRFQRDESKNFSDLVTQ